MILHQVSSQNCLNGGVYICPLKQLKILSKHEVEVSFYHKIKNLYRFNRILFTNNLENSYNEDDFS